MGKIYHAIRIEFQFRGSPCICRFPWVLNAPALITDSKEEYIFFVDKIVQPYLPEKYKHPQLYDLVDLYQLQRHSKDYINSYLNLLKVFFYPSRDHFRQANFMSEVYLNIFDRA